MKDTNTKKTKTKTQNATTTPANPTQTTDQSIITIIFKYNGKTLRGLGKTCGIGNENVTSHQRFTYNLQ